MVTIVSKIPRGLAARIAALVLAAGIGGGVVIVREDMAKQGQIDAYVQAVASDASTSQAVKVAMVLGSYYESGGRHIGTPYVDKLGKGQPLTVCNGITGRGVIAGKTYTPAECYRMERDRYVAYEKEVSADMANWGQLMVLQKATVLDFIHNVGSAGFRGSTMRRKLLAGDIVGACRENRKWVYGTINGSKAVLPGLVIRRGANSDLCDGTARIEGVTFDG